MDRVLLVVHVEQLVLEAELETLDEAFTGLPGSCTRQSSLVSCGLSWGRLLLVGLLGGFLRR